VLGKCLAPARELAHVADVRVLGAIGVIELTAPLRPGCLLERLLELGLWLRPFGHLVYAMPPYVIDEAPLWRLGEGMLQLVAGLGPDDFRA